MKKRITLTLTDEDMGWFRRAFASADDLEREEESDASRAALEKLEKAWERAKPQRDT